MKKVVKRGLIGVLIVVALGIIFIPRLGWLETEPTQQGGKKGSVSGGSLPVSGIVAQYTE